MGICAAIQKISSALPFIWVQQNFWCCGLLPQQVTLVSVTSCTIYLLTGSDITHFNKGRFLISKFLFADHTECSDNTSYCIIRASQSDATVVCASYLKCVCILEWIILLPSMSLLLMGANCLRLGSGSHARYLIPMGRECHSTSVFVSADVFTSATTRRVCHHLWCSSPSTPNQVSILCFSAFHSTYLKCVQ